MIETIGASVIYLPTYSPELNPIENIWSKVKCYLRKVTILDTEQLYQAIADALKTITEMLEIASNIACNFVYYLIGKRYS